MAKASDNVFPKLITGMQTTDPSAPADSSWKLYSKAGGVYARSSNGVVGPFGAGATGAITSSAYTMSTSRLLGRTTASTGAIEEISVGSGLSLAAGSLSATGGGSSFGQVNPPPSSFSGNDDAMSATTNWVDVDAFTVKEILDSTVLHLQTVGASQDDRVRYTLGTTRAGAFDFRFYGVMLSAQHWSGDFDTYLEIYLTTSAPAGMAMVRYGVQNTVQGNKKIRFGQSGVVTTNTENIIQGQTALDIKIVRDGSNNVTFYTRNVGASGWHTVLTQANNKPYTVSSSGTIARVELSIHTPAGPAAGEHVCDAYIDAFKDAS